MVSFVLGIRKMGLLLAVLLVLDLCSGLNDEGRALLRFRDRVELDPYGALAEWNEEGASDPCPWFGVECLGGSVVALSLRNLLLKGTLAPELGKLLHLKYLILQNNSFYGNIPGEIGDLQKLEVMDLGQNDLSGPIPSGLSRILSLGILMTKNNKILDSMSTELHELTMLSELEVDEEMSLLGRRSHTWIAGDTTGRRLMQGSRKEKRGHHRSRRSHVEASASPSLSPSISQAPFPLPKILGSRLPPSTSPFLAPISPPMASPFPMAPSPLASVPAKSTPGHSHSPALEHFPAVNVAPPSPSVLISLSPLRSTAAEKHVNSWTVFTWIVSCVSICLVLSATYVLCWRANKVIAVRPWVTGLSGQLQKAFVTGVPALKRSELDAACEQFSNVVGSLSDCLLYKGTLSSGVEIAVTSSVVTIGKDWTEQSESLFRERISVLSKVNHKNFMNLLGYCEEEEPFTRMMVFEYAPCGTLFEHLHIKEAEHLDWATRLRIIMGIVYCLEHMDQLKPPVIPRSLNSSSIYLTEDYAAKVSDLEFWNDGGDTRPPPPPESLDPTDALSSNPENIVYKFGIVLLEILSGRRPFCEDDGLLVLWASSYFSGKRPIKDMIDPTLNSVQEEDTAAISEIIRSCINPDPTVRPTMAQVASRLREITGISPDGATPKLSPLWWAELEILSTEAN